MFYVIYDKNIVEYYSMYHVSLFSEFGKMGSFLFTFLATNLSITPLFLYTYVAPNTTNQIQAVNLPL